MYATLCTTNIQTCLLLLCRFSPPHRNNIFVFLFILHIWAGISIYLLTICACQLRCPEIDIFLFAGYEQPFARTNLYTQIADMCHMFDTMLKILSTPHAYYVQGAAYHVTYVVDILLWSSLSQYRFSQKYIIQVKRLSIHKYVENKVYRLKVIH